MKTPARIALVLSLMFTPLPCFAQAAPAATLPADGRIKMLAYDESDVYTIVTKYGFQTNIVFDPKEEIVTISIGDRSLWHIIPAGHRLFIKPLKENASTNMTLLTNRRSYQFDLKSVGPEDEGNNNIYVAKFIYPGDPLWNNYIPSPAKPVVLSSENKPAEAEETTQEEAKETTAPVKETAAEPTPPVTPMPAEKAVTEQAPPPVVTGTPNPIYPNYNYTYVGPDSAAPLQVYDNGQSTFIRYLALPATLPDVFVIDTAGNRVKVQPSAKGDTMEVRTVAGTMELVKGSDTITVYNEMLNPEKPI